MAGRPSVARHRSPCLKQKCPGPRLPLFLKEGSRGHLRSLARCGGLFVCLGLPSVSLIIQDKHFDIYELISESSEVMDNIVRLHDSSLRHLVDDVKDARDGLSGNTITVTMRVTGRDYRRPCAALVKSRSQQERTVIGISPLPSVSMLLARLIEIIPCGLMP